MGFLLKFFYLNAPVLFYFSVFVCLVKVCYSLFSFCFIYTSVILQLYFSYTSVIFQLCFSYISVIFQFWFLFVVFCLFSVSSFFVFGFCLFLFCLFRCRYRRRFSLTFPSEMFGGFGLHFALTSVVSLVWGGGLRRRSKTWFYKGVVIPTLV